MEFYWQFCTQSFLSPPSASEDEAFQHHNVGYCFRGKLRDPVWRLNKMGVVKADNRCRIGPCGSAAQCKFLPFFSITFALRNFLWTSTEDSVLLVFLF